MEPIFHKAFLGHDTEGHPENALRLEAFQQLPDADILDGEKFLPLVHSPEYIERVREASISQGHVDHETFMSPGSFRAACHAVGATIRAAETGGFALVRPPGHHAYPYRSSGFCLFNNIAIATQYLIDMGKRVLILDFDGHMGDGTCEIFYTTDQVLFWSLHQYPAFPGNGFVDEIGAARGEGFSINVPLPPGSADDIFIDAVRHFLPMAKAFQPDVVAVSAGFDAHWNEPLLDLKVSNNAYYEIGNILRSEFDQIFAALEGGYNRSDLPKCVFNFLAGMNGLEQPFTETPTQSGLRVWETYEIHVNAATARLRPYWKIL